MPNRKLLTEFEQTYKMIAQMTDMMDERDFAQAIHDAYNAATEALAALSEAEQSDPRYMPVYMAVMMIPLMLNRWTKHRIGFEIDTGEQGTLDGT